MAGPFAITAASNTVRLDVTRRAETSFTVFNNSGRAIRGRARLVAQNSAAENWISLVGDPGRDFAIAGTQQYAVQIAVPADAVPGSYSFRLDEVGVENPDEELTEGPAVQFEVPAPALKPKGIPMWIPIALIVALLAIAAATFAVLNLNPPPATPTVPPPTEIPTLAPTVPPTITPTPGPRTFNSAFRLEERLVTYELLLTAPGQIVVQLRDSDSTDVTMNIDGPNGTAAQQTGAAPLTLAYNVSAADFATASNWRVVIRNNDDQGTNAQLILTHPDGNGSTPLDRNADFAFGLSSYTIMFSIRPGGQRISARAEWDLPAYSLRMLIQPPNSHNEQQESTGQPPLLTEYSFSARGNADVSLWEVMISGDEGNPSMNGEISVTYP